MDHRLGAAFAQRGDQRRAVANVAAHHADLLAGDTRNARQGLGMTVAEVVEDRHPVTGVEQFDAGMGTDVTGAAGDQKRSCYSPKDDRAAIRA